MLTPLSPHPTSGLSLIHPSRSPFALPRPSLPCFAHPAPRPDPGPDTKILSRCGGQLGGRAWAEPGDGDGVDYASIGRYDEGEAWVGMGEGRKKGASVAHILAQLSRRPGVQGPGEGTFSRLGSLRRCSVHRAMAPKKAGGTHKSTVGPKPKRVGGRATALRAGGGDPCPWAARRKLRAAPTARHSQSSSIEVEQPSDIEVEQPSDIEVEQPFGSQIQTGNHSDIVSKTDESAAMMTPENITKTKRLCDDLANQLASAPEDPEARIDGLWDLICDMIEGGIVIAFAQAHGYVVERSVYSQKDCNEIAAKMARCLAKALAEISGSSMRGNTISLIFSGDEKTAKEQWENYYEVARFIHKTLDILQEFYPLDPLLTELLPRSTLIEHFLNVQYAIYQKAHCPEELTPVDVIRSLAHMWQLHRKTGGMASEQHERPPHSDLVVLQDLCKRLAHVRLEPYIEEYVQKEAAKRDHNFLQELGLLEGLLPSGIKRFLQLAKPDAIGEPPVKRLKPGKMRKNWFDPECLEKGCEVVAF